MHFARIINRVVMKKHRHSEGNEDIESHSYMYDTGNNPTTTYLEVGDSIGSSLSGRFGSSSSSSKHKRRFYNTRYLRFGWTRRSPRESQQNKHKKYFRRNKGISLIETSRHPQSAADNQGTKIVRSRPKAFKRTSPGSHNPLAVASPVEKTADKTGKKTAAKARTLPRYFPTKGVQRDVTTKTSATMKDFRTSKNIVETHLLLSSEDQTASGDGDQINSSGDQEITHSRNFCDTSF